MFLPIQKGMELLRQNQKHKFHARKTSRSTHLRSLSASKRMDWHSEHCGQEVRVLLENPKGESIFGFTDNYLKVMVNNQSGKNANHFASVKIKSAQPEFCLGEILHVEK